MKPKNEGADGNFVEKVTPATEFEDSGGIIAQFVLPARQTQPTRGNLKGLVRSDERETKGDLECET